MEANYQHFVYVYRDKTGNPVYFGQGKRATRPASHKKGSHNISFDRWLKSQGGHHKVEVIGPLGSKDMADAIETALISACIPALALQPTFFNLHKGRSVFRFRPFGMPDKYADRTVETLGKQELAGLCRAHGPIMFVRINQEEFNDGPGRVGYNLATPPSDAEIKARVEAWWQVKNRVPTWTLQRESSPALLIGVTGGPGTQLVIGSAWVDRSRWSLAQTEKNGLLKVPLSGASLDAARLRGRPIALEVGLIFNSFRHSQFRILTVDGFEHKAKAQ